MKVPPGTLTPGGKLDNGPAEDELDTSNESKPPVVLPPSTALLISRTPWEVPGKVGQLDVDTSDGPAVVLWASPIPANESPSVDPIATPCEALAPTGATVSVASVNSEPPTLLSTPSAEFVSSTGVVLGNVG
mmetsp:Transcript_135940/g.344202  ORF Transcript_135940/g.344202 Transcript_135940/m.344202 type:complete len:132 (+) Transcript_135940:411-806(+)